MAALAHSELKLELPENELVSKFSSFNITDIRKYASNMGHKNVWRMKKADIVKLLESGPPSSEELPLQKPQLVRQVAMNPNVEEEPVQKQPAQRGVNLRLLRSDCKRYIAVCENPQLLLNILGMLKN